MKRKDLVRRLLAPEPAEEMASEASEEAVRRPASGAVRAMGLDLDRLVGEARRATELERQVGGGRTEVELDPGRVDPSIVEDRVARTGDAEYRRLVESIASSGQQVPILVRRHPTDPDRYQVAYGHRRLAAAAELGIQVRAVVRPLTDAELVVAQGKENAERRNLTFIERAVFAAELEARGFDRATLHAALAAHPAEMTRYLAVSRAVPRWLVRAIGPAPRAGRPRWMEVAELLSAEGAKEGVADLVERAAFRNAPSDRRFEMAVATLRQGPGHGARIEAGVTVIRGPDGRAVIGLEGLPGGARLTVYERASPGLSAFLAERLPALVAEFHREPPGAAQRGRTDAESPEGRPGGRSLETP